MDLSSVSDRELFQEFQKRMRCSTYPKRNVIFIGPPGSGKGTQTQKLSEKYCWCPISTGDMLREAVRLGNDLGKKAKSIMDKGDLVPDDLIIGLIENKVGQPECRYGFAMDGFPRTQKQAEMLDKLLETRKEKIDKVFSFKIQDSTLVERITGRRIHQKSGRSYHIKFNPPKIEGKDDVTGEPLIQRSDDNENVLKNRLLQYHTQTQPILQHYQKSNNLIEIDAEQNIQNIWQQLAKSI